MKTDYVNVLEQLYYEDSLYTSYKDGKPRIEHHFRGGGGIMYTKDNDFIRYHDGYSGWDSKHISKLEKSRLDKLFNEKNKIPTYKEQSVLLNDFINKTIKYYNDNLLNKNIDYNKVPKDYKKVANYIYNKAVKIDKKLRG